MYRERGVNISRSVCGAHGRTITAWHYIISDGVVKGKGRCRGRSSGGGSSRDRDKGRGWVTRGKSGGSKTLVAGHCCYVRSAMIGEKFLEFVDSKQLLIGLGRFFRVTHSWLRFTAMEPPTAAATIARTVMTPSAILKKNFV